MDIQEKVLLKDFTTFKIGGPAKFFALAKELEELVDLLSWAKQKKERVFILGSGGNVLFKDSGFDGLIIKLENKNIEIVSNEKDGALIKVGSGVSLARLLQFALDNEFTGLEWTAGIPSSLGGAIRGNAGARNLGGEMGDVVESVRALDSNEKSQTTEENLLHTFFLSQCKFGYRESLFKQQQQWIIWDALIKLKTGVVFDIEKKIKEIIEKRKLTQPALAQFPSAGSIFKNPVVSSKVKKMFEEDRGFLSKDFQVPAGWLIDQADLKGKCIGGAKVSEKQANFIVNTGGATAEDVMILISLIKQKVRKNFGVQLEKEIEVVY